MAQEPGFLVIGASMAFDLLEWLAVGITSTYTLPLYSTAGRSTPYVTSYTNWQSQWKSGIF